MQKPTILLDVDGVLVDHSNDNLAALNATFGTTYTKDSITSFTYDGWPEEHRQFLFNWWHTTSYDSFHLSNEQLDTITGLRTIARVIACSSPLAGHTDSKLRFLLRYFPREDIILTPSKNLVMADILIDDAPHNIEAWHSHAIIFDQPWNRFLPGPRAKSFDALGPLVLSYLMDFSDYDLS